MKELIVIALLIFVSISGSRLSFFNRKTSLGFKNLMLTGTEYIFIGLLLGNIGFKLIDINTIIRFEPFLIFGLSVIGYLFGLQFKIKQLKKLPKYYFLISFIQALLTFLTVSFIMYFLLNKFLSIKGNSLILISMTIGSFSSTTAQSALAIVNQNYRFKNYKIIDMLRYISSIDGFYAICFFIITLGIFPKGHFLDFSLLQSITNLLFSLITGILPAFIFIILSKSRLSKQEFFAVLVGTVLFGGGLSFQISYSPLISGFAGGIVIANFCKKGSKAISGLIKSEKSFYIILLIFMGAMFEPETLSMFSITIVYFISRGFGKVTGTFIGLRLYCNKMIFPKTTGFGLLSEGGISVAIVMSFKMIYPELATPLISVLIISVFLNELLSPYFILKQFKKDEINHINIRQKIKSEYPEIDNEE